MRKLSGLIIVGLLGTAGCAEPPPPAPPPPPDVEIAEVLQRDVPVYSEAIGESRGSLEIDVRARVAGVLQTVPPGIVPGHHMTVGSRQPPSNMVPLPSRSGPAEPAWSP